jgi:hypothetical protein
MGCRGVKWQYLESHDPFKPDDFCELVVRHALDGLPFFLSTIEGLKSDSVPHLLFRSVRRVIQVSSRTYGSNNILSKKSESRDSIAEIRDHANIALRLQDLMKHIQYNAVT